MGKKKKDDDRLGSDPFNSVLPFIQDSRKKKDADSNNDVSSDADSAVNSDADKSSDKNNNADNDVVNDSADNINSDVNKIVDNVSDVDNAVNSDAVNDTVSDSVPDNVVSKNSDNVNAIDSDADVYAASNTITIPKKKNKSGEYMRMTFYLRPEHIKFINRLHKDSGRDKSELVRMAVDILIERARVE